MPAERLDLRAYTVVYESLIPDQDGAHAREVADFLKIPHAVYPDGWAAAVRTMGRTGNRARPNLLTIRSLRACSTSSAPIAADCRVVLSGEGADNLMHFEMWPFARDLMRDRQWISLFRETSRYLWLRPSVIPGLKRRAQGLFGKDPTAPVYPRWLQPDFARRLNLQDRAKEWSELPTDRPHPDSSQGTRITLFTALVFHVRAGKSRSDALPG